MLTKNYIIFNQIQLPISLLYIPIVDITGRQVGTHLSIVMGISSKITFTLLHQKCSIIIVLYDLLMLMLKTSTLWWPIYIISSVDETKLSCNTPPLPPPPPMQHHSFFRNLQPYSFVCLSVTFMYIEI